MADRCTMPFPSMSFMKILAPNLIKHLTADRAPELEANNRGVDFSLKKNQNNNLKCICNICTLSENIKKLFVSSFRVR